MAIWKLLWAVWYEVVHVLGDSVHWLHLFLPKMVIFLSQTESAPKHFFIIKSTAYMYGLCLSEQ
jgi:hypothetical protein